MTLTKEDFAHIVNGDWLHVEFPNGSQVSGTVSRVELKLWFSYPHGAATHVIGSSGAVYASRIISPLPPKRIPKVGDVVEMDEWDKYAWPAEGSTWLTSASGAFLRSVNGDCPQIYDGTPHASGPYRFTVVQLPEPVSVPRILHTVEEVEALPVGAIVVDAEDETAKRRQPVANGRVWVVAGDSIASLSHHLTLPVTVLREGEAAE